MVIRPVTLQDADDLWEIFHRVVAGRDTYAFTPDTSRAEGVGYWFGDHVTAFAAESEGRVVAMYKLIANHRGLGAHVSNASFMVHPDAAGRGIGRALGLHCLSQARLQGYEAMQFNFVVSTNERAIALWQSLGFEIIATLPNAFRHGTLGLVNAYVMHRSLHDVIPIFGEERRTAEPRVRPCAYVVVSTRGSDGGPCLALVTAHEDVLLPGGGLDPGEDHTAAAIREVAEECALGVAIRGVLGDAIQFVGGRDGRPVVEKRGRFFAGDEAQRISGTPEHDVLWLSPEQARQTVTNDSHRWAITRWARLNT